MVTNGLIYVHFDVFLRKYIYIIHVHFETAAGENPLTYGIYEARHVKKVLSQTVSGHEQGKNSRNAKTEPDIWKRKNGNGNTKRIGC